MAIKPGKLCVLQKDKFLVTQTGFADTFNWVVAAMNNLTGGQNCEVTWVAPDTPQIDANTQTFEGGGGGGGGGGETGVSEITIVGTTSQATSVDGELVFAAASDTNITMSCDGNTITFGVYYI